MLLHNLRQVTITVFPNSCGVSVNFEIHVFLLEIATLRAVSGSSAAAGLRGPCRHLAERPSPDTRDVSSPAVRCSTRFICKNPCASHNSLIGWLLSSSLPASGMEAEDGRQTGSRRQRQVAPWPLLARTPPSYLPHVSHAQGFFPP